MSLEEFVQRAESAATLDEEASDMASTTSNVRQDDWDGPDDLDCPYNWPMWKRIYMTSLPAFLCINV